MLIRLLVVLSMLAPTACSAQMFRRCRTCSCNHVRHTCCSQTAHLTTSPQVISVGSTATNLSAGTVVQTVGYQAATFQSYHPALAVINQRRRSAGLSELLPDPQLMAVAQTKSQLRANRRMTGHDGSHRGGAAVEGVGFAMGGGDLTGRFSTCYLYSSGYRYAGAGVAYDGSGRAYYTLLLR